MGQGRGSRNGRVRKPALSGGHGDEGEQASRPAYRSARTVTVFLSVVVLGTAADLLAKHYAFACLMEAPMRSVEVIGSFLRLTLSTNRGIVFGIEVPGWLILAAMLGAMAVVVFLFATSSVRWWGLHVALGMVLAGSLGNAYDRLFGYVCFSGEPGPRTEEVRDFIDVDLYFMRWPVFNIADALLVVGVALIVLHMLRDRRRQRD